jgi:hypothetical protein
MKKSISFLLFAINVIAIFLLWPWPVFLALLTLAFGVALLILHRKPLLYIATLVIATVFELMAVHVGIWHYSSPSILGIPFWIPIAWANLVLILQ